MKAEEAGTKVEHSFEGLMGDERVCEYGHWCTCRCAGYRKGASENVLEVYPFECGYEAGSELKLELEVE